MVADAGVLGERLLPFWIVLIFGNEAAVDCVTSLFELLRNLHPFCN